MIGGCAEAPSGTAPEGSERGSMASDAFALFDAIARRMAWLGRRQDVLARNIANADTPGFVAKDLEEAPFGRVLARRLRPASTMRPAATHPAHLGGDGGADGVREARVVEAPDESTPSGNAVVLEEQLVKVARTQTDYRAMSNLYRKHLALFRAALGRGGG